MPGLWEALTHYGGMDGIVFFDRGTPSHLARRAESDHSAGTPALTYGWNLAFPNQKRRPGGRWTPVPALASALLYRETGCMTPRPVGAQRPRA